MAGERYFVRSRGKITGPFDQNGLQRLAKMGMLSRVHEVSTDKVNWALAATIPGIIPEASSRGTSQRQSEYEFADTPSGADEVAESPSNSAPPAAARNESAPAPPAGNGPMIACVSCGSVLPAAQLFNDRGRYICPSCYQRLVLGAPPARSYTPEGAQSAGYFGSGVASLILGIAGIIIPTAGPLCLLLAIRVADMTVVFWGILLAGLACAIAATAFGSVTLRGNRKARSRDGNGLAITGLILGIISLSGYAMWLVYLVIIFVAAALKAAAVASAAAAKAAAIKAAKAKAAAAKVAAKAKTAHAAH